MKEIFQKYYIFIKWQNAFRKICWSTSFINYGKRHLAISKCI